MNQLELGSVPFSLEQNPKIDEELEILSEKSFIQLLDHAFQCPDANCKVVNCLKMKFVAEHANSCKEIDKGGCPSCKKLQTLCSSHAEQCEVVNCTFPLCVRNKIKFQLQQPQVRVQQLSLEFDDKGSHSDEMKKLEDDLNLINLNDSSPSDQLQTISKEMRKTPTKRFSESLIHACQCLDANCKIDRCLKMKRILQHTDFCKRKISGGCPVCKQIIAMCCYHAKHCEKEKCQVRFCVIIKRQLKQQQVKGKPSQHQLRMGSLMHEQIINSFPIRSLMNTTMEHRQKLKQDMVRVGGVSQPQKQQSKPVFPNRETQPTPNLVSQALQQVLQTLKHPSAQQQQRILATLKSNTPLMSAFIKQRTAAKQMSQQHQVQLQQQQQLQGPPHSLIRWPESVSAAFVTSPQQTMMAMIGNNLELGIAGSSQPPNQNQQSQPGSSIQGMQGGPRPNQIPQVLQQLLQTLKSPSSAQQQQQALAILKANPRFMSAFIDHRERAIRNQLKEKR